MSVCCVVNELKQKKTRPIVGRVIKMKILNFPSFSTLLIAQPFSFLSAVFINCEICISCAISCDSFRSFNIVLCEYCSWMICKGSSFVRAFSSLHNAVLLVLGNTLHF